MILKHNEKINKVVFNKSSYKSKKGNDVYNTKISLPKSWLRVLGVSKEQPQVKLIFNENKKEIIITKVKFTLYEEILSEVKLKED